jgi:transketolase
MLHESDKTLAGIANAIRTHVLRMSLNAGTVGAHLGGALSMAEILTVLYFDFLRYDRNNPFWDQRDRLILSKGHGSPALYAVLAMAGFFNEKELATFKADGSYLSAHPSMNLQMGIEFSTGSLGQGLSLAVGVGLAMHRKRNMDTRVVCILGDGEINEGSVWEAAMAASHFKLTNLVAIVDRNGLQQDGPTEKVMNLGNLTEKWLSFGWNCKEIDGHNIDEIQSVLKEDRDKPLCIVARTIKGKGVSFMEGNRSWHHSRLTKTQFDEAIRELNGDIPEVEID